MITTLQAEQRGGSTLGSPSCSLPSSSGIYSFRCVVADPPWDYAGKTVPWRSTSKQSYDLMKLEDICALPVNSITTGDAHLYLWAVLPMMREAYEVVEAWGFTPETVITWCKRGPGLGGGWRGNTEHLIVARKGWSSINPTCQDCGGRARGIKKCGCDAPKWRVKGKPLSEADQQRASFLTTAPGTWYEAPRRDHSEKPDLFMDLVEQMSPGPRLEMFARNPRLGWASWGNESLCHVDLSSESQREAAGTADGKPDGQAENSDYPEPNSR